MLIRVSDNNYCQHLILAENEKTCFRRNLHFIQVYTFIQHKNIIFYRVPKKTLQRFNLALDVKIDQVIWLGKLRLNLCFFWGGTPCRIKEIFMLLLGCRRLEWVSKTRIFCDLNVDYKCAGWKTFKNNSSSNTLLCWEMWVLKCPISSEMSLSSLNCLLSWFMVLWLI